MKPTADRNEPTAVSPDKWVTCGLGPYNLEFMTEVMREMMARCRADGVFINRWEGAGMCYCRHCRRNARVASRATCARVWRERPARAPRGPGRQG